MGIECEFGRGISTILLNYGYNYVERTFKKSPGCTGEGGYMFRLVLIFITFALALISGCTLDDQYQFMNDDPPYSGDDDGVIHYGEVTIEPTGHLTAWVRWRTEILANSVVEFGLDGLEYRVSDPELVTDHEILLAGMRAGETYNIRATSSVEDNLVFQVADIEFANDSLPDWLPLETEFNWGVYDEDMVEPGWTVCNIAVFEGDASMVTTPVTVVVLDHEGQPIFFYRQEAEIPATADIEATWDGDGILVGGGLAEGKSPFKLNLAGEIVWQDEFIQPFPMSERYMHHVYHKDGSGNLTSMLVSYTDGLSDRIMTYDADMSEVWSWDSVRLKEDGYSESPDLSNVAIVEPESGVAYYGLRDDSMLYKIDMTSGEVIWEFGLNHCTQDVGDFVGEDGHPRAWPMMPHGMEHREKRWLFYDNREQTTGSRVVEYEIDEQTMETSIVWEYPGEYADDPWYAYVWGDADWLGNNNVLVTTGQSWAVEPGTEPHQLRDAWSEVGHARIFELAREENSTERMRRVWEVRLGGNVTGSYAADRFPAQIEFTQ